MTLFIKLSVTAFGAGLLRPAPGTWGSLAAFPLAWLLWRINPVVFLAAIPVVYLLGLWSTQRYIEGRTNHDPSEVVIDEVIGQWIALLPVALGALARDISPLALWPGLVSAFVFFRLFDIWKPGPVGWADRQPGAKGVMLDDAVAGLLAALSVGLLAALAHGVLT